MFRGLEGRGSPVLASLPPHSASGQIQGFLRRFFGLQPPKPSVFLLWHVLGVSFLPTGGAWGKTSQELRGGPPPAPYPRHYDRNAPVTSLQRGGRERSGLVQSQTNMQRI